MVAPLPMREQVLGLECGATMGVDCVRKSKEIIHLFDKIANEQGCYFFDPSK